MKYEIMQLKSEKRRAYGWMDYDFATKHGFSLSDYEKTYEGEEETTLEELYNEFNLNKPADFKGHSMSVSDIVIADGIIYYVDVFGFAKVSA